MFGCQCELYGTNFKALYLLLNILNDSLCVILSDVIFLYLIDIKIIICQKWNLSARIKRHYVIVYLLL